MILVNPAKECKCSVCGHVWNIPENAEVPTVCPECIKRGAVMVSQKIRYLCIKCLHIWYEDYSGKVDACPKCNTPTEIKVGQKTIRYITIDFIKRYVCSVCGNEWDVDSIEYPDYCHKCGATSNEPLPIEKNDLLGMKGPRGYSMYRGYTQVLDEKGNWTPSKEEIDARIKSGIWKERPRPIVRW
jgi:DNA-directed RNA polymerase subunit RPC12/RpoP